jgi:pimeloyl-ACP methyl ester carboxylesterase
MEPRSLDVSDDADAAATRTAPVGNGRRVSYARYGASDGTPVVFLHGTPGSRRLGALFDADAERLGVCVLAPDRPGFGGSPSWPDRTLDDAGPLVGAVLDAEGVASAPVVGFSGGGPHALAAAATRPDRTTSVALVASAVPPSLESRPPRLRRAVELLSERTPRLAGAAVRLQAAVAARASPTFVTSQYTADPDAVSTDVAELVKRDFLDGLQGTGSVTEFASLADPWAGVLDDVACPVRLWHGGEDHNVALDGARRLADRLAGGDLTVLDDADHLTTLLRSRSAVLDACVRD